MDNIPFKETEAVSTQSYSAIGLVLLLTAAVVYIVYRYLKQKGRLPDNAQSRVQVVDKKFLSAATTLYVIEKDGEQVWVCESSKQVALLVKKSDSTVALNVTEKDSK